MKYRASDRRSQKSQVTQPKEPDTIPIMNLFLTIIPMLLLMVVVSQSALVALNFNAPAEGSGGSGGSAGGGEKKTESVEIIIMAHDQADAEIFKGFRIKEPGKGNVDIHFVNGEFNFVGLKNALVDMKTRNPNLNDINIMANANVRYGALLRTIDLCKDSQIVNVGISVRRTGYGTVGG